MIGLFIDPFGIRSDIRGGVRHLRTINLLLVVSGILILSACAVSPLGRKQLKLMPGSQMDSMGVQAFRDIKQQLRVERDPAPNQYVRCISYAITKELQDYPSAGWEVVVFRDPSANAFALPGRKIGVHTGIFLVAQTQDQLAAVIGHEIGHVIAEHGNERVSSALVAQLGLATTAAILNKKGSSDYNMLMAALGIGIQFGVLLPHARSHESEADIIGLQLMAQAGFHPEESVKLWQNMGRQGGAQPPEFMSTHPSHNSRIARLRSSMPLALRHYEIAQRNGKKPNCHL